MIQRAGGGKEEKMGRWCSVTIPIYHSVLQGPNPPSKTAVPPLGVPPLHV